MFRFLISATLLLLVQLSTAREICNSLCDGSDASLATGVRDAITITVSGRLITIKISDSLDMAYATLENGMVGDELYFDRSFNGGVTWEEKIGRRQVHLNQTNLSTDLYNIDDPTILSGMGAVRACSWARNTGEHLCSAFVRSTYLAETAHEAAVAALMQFYQDTGKFKTVGWWNAANCITAMIGYMSLTGNTHYLPLIEDFYQKNLPDWWGNFTSDALDDVMWYSLWLIDAYDLTRDQKYLDVAISHAKFIGEYRDNVCGDGVWWNIYATYKNAITNELYIKLVAKLANRVEGEAGLNYLVEAKELWDWFFLPGGMVNEDFLVNDGLHECRNNNDKTFTYNQGVILGAAVELYKATGNEIYLTLARKIVEAVLASPVLNPNGILTEICESTGGCFGGNNSSFKGVFMRNLGELNRILAGRPYQDYLEKQVESNLALNRNEMNQYGYHWQGPFDFPDANRQHSVVDAFNSILP